MNRNLERNRRPVNHPLSHSQQCPKGEIWNKTNRRGRGVSAHKGRGEESRRKNPLMTQGWTRRQSQPPTRPREERQLHTNTEVLSSERSIEERPNYSQSLKKRVLANNRKERYIQKPSHSSRQSSISEVSASPEKSNRERALVSIETSPHRAVNTEEFIEPSEVEEVSSQEGDQGIYTEAEDSIMPHKASGMMSYELNVPLLQTSEDSQNLESSHSEEPSFSGISEKTGASLVNRDQLQNVNVHEMADDLEKAIERISFSEENEQVINVSEEVMHPEEIHESQEIHVMENDEEEEISSGEVNVTKNIPDKHIVQEESPSPEESSESEESDDKGVHQEEVISEKDSEEESEPRPVDTVILEVSENEGDDYGDDGDDEDVEESEGFHDDFEEDSGIPVRKGELEGKGSVEDCFNYGRIFFEDTLARSRRYEEMAWSKKTQPVFKGKMLSTRNRIHMVKEDMIMFWDALMHAVCIQLRNHMKLLIRKDSLKENEDTTQVKDALDSYIERVKDKAKDYQKYFYQELFLTSIVNRVTRAPIYPFIAVSEKNPDDNLPNYLNSMGRLIQTFVTRGVLRMDISDEPLDLSWNSWEKLDLDAWNTNNSNLRQAYKEKKFVKERAKTRGSARKRLESPLQCAITGIPIFPGDTVHRARVVFRDSLSGISKKPLKDNTKCLLFHAELKEYLYDDTTSADLASDDDDAVEEKKEEMHECSRAVIFGLLNSLSIIADSYYHNDDGDDGNSDGHTQSSSNYKKMKLDYSRGTTIWFTSQARALLGSIEIPSNDTEAIENPLRYVLRSTKNLGFLMEEIVFLKDYLETIGKMYAQQKFAIYTVRHLLGMHE